VGRGTSHISIKSWQAVLLTIDDPRQESMARHESTLTLTVHLDEPIYHPVIWCNAIGQPDAYMYVMDSRDQHH
jgi:hypothetical protein